jgi:hypothetical protein
MSRDSETSLDNVLTQLVNGALPDAAFAQVADAPQVAQLVALVRELQMLAPTPQPRLAAGRRRFLNEAARRTQPSCVFGRAGARPLRVFGFAVALVALVFGVLMLAETSPLGERIPVASSSTLTTSPTHMITPTGTTAVPGSLAPIAPTLVTRWANLPHPKPVPTPMVVQD